MDDTRRDLREGKRGRRDGFGQGGQLNKRACARPSRRRPKPQALSVDATAQPMAGAHACAGVARARGARTQATGAEEWHATSWLGSDRPGPGHAYGSRGRCKVGDAAAGQGCS